MTYTDIASVQKRLLNSNLGVSGSQIIDDSQIAELITAADDRINFELELTSNTTDTRFTGVLKDIATTYIFMNILRGRHMKENNIVQEVGSYWSISPEFTRADQVRLNRIKERLRSKHTQNFNTLDGSEVS